MKTTDVEARLDRLLGLYPELYFSKRNLPDGTLMVVLFYGFESDLLDKEELCARLQDAAGPSVRIELEENSALARLPQLETLEALKNRVVELLRPIKQVNDYRTDFTHGNLLWVYLRYEDESERPDLNEIASGLQDAAGPLVRCEVQGNREFLKMYDAHPAVEWHSNK